MKLQILKSYLGQPLRNATARADLDGRNWAVLTFENGETIEFPLTDMGFVISVMPPTEPPTSRGVEVTPEQIKKSNEEFQAERTRNIEKIKKFIIENPTQDQLEEIASSLLNYYEEYGIECFNQLELEY